MQLLSDITAERLRDDMESRFGFLNYTDQQDGLHAGEFAVLEELLTDSIIDEGTSECSQQPNAPVVNAQDWVQDFDGRSGGSRPSVGSAPRLLTGGIPSTDGVDSPMPNRSYVPEFSSGGYDGGIEVGFDGTWNPLKFSDLLDELESAKDRCSDIGGEGFPIVLAGEQVLVKPMGGKAGGLLYKYRFVCRGVEFLIHSNPPQGRQPVRVCYRAESVQGKRDRFFNVHNEFVVPFLSRLGLVIHGDKISRVDAQVMLDVPVEEIIRLFESGHVVTKLRKGSIHFSVGRSVQKKTLTLGNKTNVQLCMYDKTGELCSGNKNMVKEADFITHCVSPDWVNSGRSVTRIEIRLGRDALKSLGVHSVSDLQERERAVYDLITLEWFRILESPKVRGHENTASLHPIWECVRSLFSRYFSGCAVESVSWQRKDSLSCNPVALERQALGCLSKALAVRFGVQDSCQSSVKHANDWVDHVRSELHERINKCVCFIELQTGFTLGVSVRSSSGYDVDDDLRDLRRGMEEIGRRKSGEFRDSVVGRRDFV